ncbi:hypothetical protein Ahy_A09g044965 [Arachis hypogaea]|uniref:Uncharacterized protein n=1 Tax=Arachis hypogaea TaxID=3818 RepID=A0A445BL84_ARAHY|nr:hypothetical protein Ahy_A09g044965 [Arachis hypogaea]
MRRQKLWKGVQNLVNLELVDLNYSSHLVELPDFSKAPNLEEVNVSNCKSLQQIPQSILSSQRLVSSHHQSLKTLSFYSCIGLREFPLTQLNHNTNKLVLSALLEWLKLDYCSILSLLPDNISILSSLKDLSICHSSVRSLPESIKRMSRLKYLNLSNCERLQSVPELPSSILGLIAFNCISLHTIFIVKDVRWNAELGGQNMKLRLVEHFVDEFNKQVGGGIDVRKFPKSMEKLKKQVKQTKEILNANTTAPISVESLHNLVRSK